MTHGVESLKSIRQNRALLRTRPFLYGAKKQKQTIQKKNKVNIVSQTRQEKLQAEKWARLEQQRKSKTLLLYGIMFLAFFCLSLMWTVNLLK